METKTEEGWSSIMADSRLGASWSIHRTRRLANGGATRMLSAFARRKERAVHVLARNRVWSASVSRRICLLSRRTMDTICNITECRHFCRDA